MSHAKNSAKGHNVAIQGDYLDINNFYSVKKLNEQLADSRVFDEDSISERLGYLAKYAYNEAFSSVARN